MTDLQLRVFDVIRDRLTEAGYSPTRSEIANAVGVSEGRVSDLITALIRQGKLEREAGKQRSLRVAGAPDLTLVGTGELRAELARRGVTFDALRERPMPLGRGAHCAATFCEERVGRGKIMCRDHWFAVDRDLRDRIFRTFHAKDHDAYGEAVREAIEQADAAGSGRA